MQIASVLCDEAEEIFDRIDLDGDRRISFEEYAALLRGMDPTKPEAELRQGFNAIDSDRDGMVSFEELHAWVSR